MGKIIKILFLMLCTSVIVKIYSETVTQLLENIEKSDEKAVHDIIKSGKVNLADRDPVTGFTPLLKAAIQGNISIIRELLFNGVDIDAMFINRETGKKINFLDLIKEMKVHPKVIQEFNDWIWRTQEYIKLVAAKKISQANDLLAKGVLVTTKYDPETAISETIKSNDTKLLINLLSNKSDINKINKNLEHPLIYAIELKNTDIVGILIKAGADINAKAKNGQSALHLAVLNRDPKIVKLLVNKTGIKLNQKDNSGKTPLHLAAQNGLLNMIKLLLVAAENVPNADLNSQDLNGSTALHLAAKNGQRDVAKLLIDINANPKIIDGSANTPLEAVNATIKDLNKNKDSNLDKLHELNLMKLMLEKIT